MMKRAIIVLADGSVIEGHGFGGDGTAMGEVVFNTSMSGYQEALTDPSYKYQILMFTYPLIGNYGITKTDSESDKVQAEGAIVHELIEKPNNGKMIKTLDEFLKEQSKPGIYGVDTRSLTRKIREFGVMNGVIATEPYDINELKKKVLKMSDISKVDLVGRVTISEEKKHDVGGEKTICLLDCGEKKSIIDEFLKRKINVIRLPARTNADKIMGYDPDGIVISNGPGDPKSAPYAIETIKNLLGRRIPMMGICLGHQLISLACGADTYKLKFGHRGSNHPVKDIKTGKVYITTQNHGFAVEKESINNANLEITQLNLNDGSIEGVRHKSLPVFSVQYHPEAHPGPLDTNHIFDEFIGMLE